MWCEDTYSDSDHDKLQESLFFLSVGAPQPKSTLFPYTTLFRSVQIARFSFNLRSRFPRLTTPPRRKPISPRRRSEEHTSELQSRRDLVCRLLLEKKQELAAAGSVQPASP